MQRRIFIEPNRWQLDYKRVMNAIGTAKETAKYFSSFFNFDLLKTCYFRQNNRNVSLGNALEAAYDWICCAQDAFDDGGVARSYSLVYKTYFNRKGWFPSYPETTGYIIPTIFNYSERAGNREAFNRAVRMADWECDIQMANGAIQGGFIGQPVSPAIFNTGQVIFGWVDAFSNTGNETYLSCALKAGEFLVGCQDEDGAWRKNLSDFTTDKIPFYAYNTRTAWALYMLYEQTGEKKYLNHSIKNIEFTLKHQKDNGFFENNCLSDPAKPLLHTVAYCIRGILEIGIRYDHPSYVEKAQKAADQLLQKMNGDGRLAGRFDMNWKEMVDWSCLTGQAQMAIIWGKLFKATKNSIYLNGLKKVNRFLMAKQVLSPGKGPLHGGIPGSEPMSGNYGKFEILSWAVKFFMDALMFEERIEKNTKKETG